jgi:hypothetical protein
MKYKQISSIHTAESIPALKEEDYIDNVRNYTSSILNLREPVSRSKSKRLFNHLGRGC